MDVEAWKRKNAWHMRLDRWKHPKFLYKPAGGIEAIVIRADGTREVLGKISVLYMPRKGWAKLAGMTGWDWPPKRARKPTP